MLHPPAIQPGPGQESVWDYPRPPRLEPVAERLRVIFSNAVIADSVAGYRVLETSHPPVYYIPPGDIAQAHLVAATGSSWCEFKGQARYWSLDVGGRRSVNAAWSYPKPLAGAEVLADCVALYAAGLDCRVDGAPVTPQPGGFYGGWITPELCGPFKGEPGSSGW